MPGLRLLLAHCVGEVEAGGEHAQAHAGLGLELETKVHLKVRNHGLLLVESSYYRFHI